MAADAVLLDDPDFADAPAPAVPKKADGLFIRFFHKAFRELAEIAGTDGKATKRHVWVKKEMVELRVPGDKTNAPVKFVNDEMRERWAAQYAAWKAGQDQETAGGMPLEKWPGVDVAQVEELRAAKVRTVEHLAGMSDANLAKLGPGWRPLRQAAQDWLKAAESAAPLAALREENETMRAQLEANQKQLAAMSAALKRSEKGKEKAA